MVRSVNPKREKKELGYFCIFLHLVFGRVFLPQLQLCTNLSKNRKIKQHCQVTLMRAFTHFIPTIKPTNERNSFRYVFSRVSNVSETNFRHAPDKFSFQFLYVAKFVLKKRRFLANDTTGFSLGELTKLIFI